MKKLACSAALVICKVFRYRFGMRGNMLVGIHKDQLIIRIGVTAAESIANEQHVQPMGITGRPMKGWARVEQAGLESNAELKRYCDLALSFVSGLPAKVKKPKKRK